MVKDVTEIRISDSDIEEYGLRNKYLKQYVSDKIDDIRNNCIELCSYIRNILEEKKIIKMTSNVVYVNDIVAIIPNLEKFECHSQNSSECLNIDEYYDLEFEEFKGEFLTEFEADRCFGTDSSCPFRQPNGSIRCCDKNYHGVAIKDDSFFLTLNDLDKNVFKFPSNEYKLDILTVPVYRLNDIDSEHSTSKIIFKWLENDLRPEGLNEKLSLVYDDLRYLYSKYKGEYFTESYDNLDFDQDSLIERILDDYSKGIAIRYLNDFDKTIAKKSDFESEEFIEKFKEKLLKCDAERIATKEYKEQILFDYKNGHWDLFDYSEAREEGQSVVKLPKKMYARDPKDDIQKNVVAIDFGTKSTVVSFKSDKDKKVIPLKIVGNSSFDSETNDKNPYENPSIMYFINFDEFLKKYRLRDGRPYTKWENLTVAHEAFADCVKADERSYCAFLTDLKSWCSSNCELKIKDSKEIDYQFKPFSELSENDINPVEYYAYFLGLYINNMSNQRIYTKYKMSFPVTFDDKLCEKIRASFEKGLKKSLPISIRNNDKIMKKFKVEIGLREPVSYAITALEKYNFKPQENEEEYYAVFDFGGGTTDFDFGVYKGLSEDEQEEYGKNFKLIHFGENGVMNLGGEKLLKYLAFEIFRLNTDILFNEDGNFQFTVDDGRTENEWYKLKDDGFISDSAYANRNMFNLMEKLRCVWEGARDAEQEDLLKDINGGKVKVDLINLDGKLISNIPLSIVRYDKEGTSVDIDLETEFLKPKIEDAVKEFFNSMREGFKYASKDVKQDIKELKDIGKINIFLAGNSTKSKLFNNVLNEYLGIENKSDEQENLEENNASCDSFGNIKENKNSYSKAKEILGLKQDSNLEFVLYPPLGTDKAFDMQEKCGYIKDCGYKFDRNDKSEPNCKTGVAYGMLVTDVRVEELANKEKGKVRFQFYIGKKSSTNNFVPILEKGHPFGEWVKLRNIIEDEERYPFYYTTSAEAGTAKMNIGSVAIHVYTIDIDEDEVCEDLDEDEPKAICIRVINQNTIEWRIAYRTVANKEKIELDDVKTPNLVTLEE